MPCWSSASMASTAGTRRDRCCIPAMISSSSASTCSRRMASPFRCYNDKHLSYSFEKAQWMVEASRRLKFPMLAGSSLPVTWRLPDIELPLNSEIEHATGGGIRRAGRDGLPRPGGAAVHGRAAEGRRDRRQGGSDDRGRCGVESGRGRTLSPRAPGLGALEERHAAGPDARGRPHAGSRRPRASCPSW